MKNGPPKQSHSNKINFFFDLRLWEIGFKHSPSCITIVGIQYPFTWTVVSKAFLIHICIHFFIWKSLSTSTTLINTIFFSTRKDPWMIRKTCVKYWLCVNWIQLKLLKKKKISFHFFLTFPISNNINTHSIPITFSSPSACIRLINWISIMGFLLICMKHHTNDNEIKRTCDAISIDNECIHEWMGEWK